MFRIYCYNQHSKWPEYLQQIEEWMNKLQSETTELTPQQLLTSSKKKQQIEKLIQFPTPNNQSMAHEELIKSAEEKIRRKATKREE